jgi:hypothetical protein
LLVLLTGVLPWHDANDVLWLLHRGELSGRYVAPERPHVIDGPTFWRRFLVEGLAIVPVLLVTSTAALALTS